MNMNKFTVFKISKEDQNRIGILNINDPRMIVYTPFDAMIILTYLIHLNSSWCSHFYKHAYCTHYNSSNFIAPDEHSDSLSFLSDVRCKYIKLTKT